MTRERLWQAQFDGLVEALKRYGYTYQKIEIKGAWSNGHFYREIYWDPVDCELYKPYRLFSHGGVLEIVHGDCYTCNHTHAQEFLIVMIPIIGKLDATCHYLRGEYPGTGPRLLIYL